jgi:hypothetical protein
VAQRLYSLIATPDSGDVNAGEKKETAKILPWGKSVSGKFEFGFNFENQIEEGIGETWKGSDKI